jgi:sulfatase maturation enzyme AslB (radical SAM superfamily)
MNADQLKTFSRMLTAGLARTSCPPVKVETHAGKGLQILLHHRRGRFLHLVFNPVGDEPAYFKGRLTSLRYLGGPTLSDWQQDWLEVVRDSLAVVEARSGWSDALAWAAALPAVALPASEFSSDAGNAELIRVNTRCNARCEFCSARGVLGDLIREPGRVPARIREMKAAGLDRVSFTGGEPTLLAELPELVAEAARSGFAQVDLQTNGLLLARKERVDQLVRAGLTSLFLSLHSAEPEIHDVLLRVPGAWDKAMACVAHCLEAGLVVRYNCVLTTRNLDGPARLVELIHERFGQAGFHFCLSFVALQGWALDHPELVPRLGQAAPAMRAAIESADRLGVELRIPGLCGVPICVLPDLAEHFDEFHASDPPRLASRSYVEACQACPHRPRCSGFWTAYIQRHGSGELGGV